jgi:hypothetical protein
MILKYNTLEKSMYKRMFSGTATSGSSLSLDKNNNDTTTEAFKPLAGKTLNDETKTYITDKLQ